MDITSLFIACSLMEPNCQAEPQRYSKKEIIEGYEDYFDELKKDFDGTDKEWEEFIFGDL